MLSGTRVVMVTKNSMLSPSKPGSTPGKSARR
ncbi:Uncharacterised protein [Mycobacterium tuberculosis]|nr:Uncharacterised protein [Mycobacterium tuberculosis]